MDDSGIGVRILAGTLIFPLHREASSTSALGPTQPIIQLITRALSRDKLARNEADHLVQR
jgi:hypothetical protein